MLLWGSDHYQVICLVKQMRLYIARSIVQAVGPREMLASGHENPRLWHGKRTSEARARYSKCIALVDDSTLYVLVLPRMIYSFTGVCVKRPSSAQRQPSESFSPVHS